MRDQDKGPVIGFVRYVCESVVLCIPAALCGGVLGVGVATWLQVGRTDRHLEQLGDERALRLHEETRARRARSEAHEARVELDRVRRAWMADKAAWWRVPGLPVDEAEPETIPPQNVPLVVVPPPGELGIEPK